MQTPLHITYRRLKTSTALEDRIRRHLADLERGCEGLIECHVTLELPAGRRRSRVPKIGIELYVTGRQIVVHSGEANRTQHTNIDAALIDSFATLPRFATRARRGMSPMQSAPSRLNGA
jgi:ribosome-associated translation inhibitor RaiA